MSEPMSDNPELARYFDQMDKVTPEAVRKGWQEEEMDIHGRTVEFYGVAHHPATLEIPEFRKKLESAIRRASVVFLEMAPVSFGESYEDFHALAMEHEISLSDDDLRMFFDRVVLDNPFADFYKEMLAIAATEGKDVAYVDPIRDIYSLVPLDAADADADAVKAISFLSSWGFLVARDKVLDFVQAAQRARERTTGVLERGMSRRTFLHKTAVGALGVGVVSGASVGATINQKYRGIGRDENVLGHFLYSLLDYRDCSIANGLEALAQQIEEKDRIAAIYGSAHLSGVSHYLEHPIERAAKLMGYAPTFGRVSDRHLVLYSFSDGVWSPKSEKK